MSNCRSCAAPLRDGARFCSVCAAPVEDPAGPEPAPGRRLRWLVLSGVVALAVGGAAALLLLGPGRADWTVVASQTSSSTGSSVRTTSTGPATTTASTTATATASLTPADVEFLRRLDVVLHESTLGRKAVVEAVSGTSDCSLAADSARQLIAQGVANRQALLDQLSPLAPPDDVTMRLRDDLVTALTASRDAAQQYAAWIDDVWSTGCTGTAPQDSAYATAVTDSDTATAAKQAFAAEYDPLAAAAGLATWAEPDF